MEIGRLQTTYEPNFKPLEQGVTNALRIVNELTVNLNRAGDEGDRAFERAGQSAQRFANQTVANVSSAVRNAFEGDFRSAINSVSDVAADALKLIPSVGTGLSAIYKDATAAMMEATDTGFRFNDVQKRAGVGFTLIAGDARRAREEIADGSAHVLTPRAAAPNVQATTWVARSSISTRRRRQQDFPRGQFL